MSSIMEKMSSETSGRPVKLEKRNFFLRSSSIQKIKCSATYPFRIAGSKLSREAIKQLIESLIIKARLFSQNALLILYIATLKVLGANSPLSHNNLSANDDVCDKLKETEKELTFIERLLARLVKLHVHKLGRQSVGKDQDKREREHHPLTQSKVETETLIENKTVGISASKRLLSAEKTESKKPNLLLVTVVYGSAIFLYIQLLALTIALNTAPTPPGLIFLIVSLSFIGYLAFKVFFQDGKRLSKRCKNSRKNSRSQESSSEQEDKDSVQRNTQSRLTIRRTFDFGGKTLSKIKML